MPQPHEQKLQDVVNSLTADSFKSFVAARIAGTSTSPPSASPAPPPNVSLNRSLRLMVALGARSDSPIGSPHRDVGRAPGCSILNRQPYAVGRCWRRSHAVLSPSPCHTRFVKSSALALRKTGTRPALNGGAVTARRDRPRHVVKRRGIPQ